MWNYEGLIVSGKYLNEFPVAGRVIQSRVSYGGTVKHTIKLDKPLEVYSAIRDHVILEMSEVERVYSN